MDRNDRRHLPGFYDMIARGQMHSQYGGPDHIDAAPVMKQREPVGSVFGCIDPLPQPMRPTELEQDAKYRPTQFRHMDFSETVEPDCAPPILDHGPVNTRGLTNFNVDQARANLVEKQWKHSVCDSKYDSGYSGSLQSTNSLNSCDETELLPSFTSAPSSSLTHKLKNLSLEKGPNINDFEKQERSQHKRVSITSSEEEANVGVDSTTKCDSVLLSSLNPTQGGYTPNIEEFTAKFNRNLKYFEQDQDCETNLHHLLYSDREEFDNMVLQILSDLINYQFLDICNKSKQTILHVATIMNKPHVVRSIMAHGAPVDIRDSNGNTALHIACQKGYMQCVEELTKPLTYEEVKDVSYQVPFRCIPQCMELKNYDGFTCLHLAALNNNFDVVHYLVHDLRADVNSMEGKRGMTPLVCCVERRNAQMLMYLVQQCKANIHVRTYDRKNGYELAVGRNFPEIANLLKSIDPQVASPEEEEEDWIEEDFDDFTMNGHPVSM